MPKPRHSIVKRKPARPFRNAIRTAKRRLARFNTRSKAERERHRLIESMRADMIARRDARSKARADFAKRKPQRMAREARIAARKALVDHDSVEALELKEARAINRRNMRYL